MKGTSRLNINELNTNDMASVEITCTNGQKKKGATYLSNVILAEGWAENSREMAALRYRALTLLKKRMEPSLPA